MEESAPKSGNWWAHRQTWAFLFFFCSLKNKSTKNSYPFLLWEALVLVTQQYIVTKRMLAFFWDKGNFAISIRVQTFPEEKLLEQCIANYCYRSILKKMILLVVSKRSDGYQSNSTTYTPWTHLITHLLVKMKIGTEKHHYVTLAGLTLNSSTPNHKFHNSIRLNFIFQSQGIFSLLLAIRVGTWIQALDQILQNFNFMWKNEIVKPMKAFLDCAPILIT